MLSAACVDIGDGEAKAVAPNSVLVAICPSKSGSITFTCPSACIDGAVGIIAPEVGGSTLALDHDDKRAFFWRIDLPSTSEKFVFTLRVDA